MAEALHKWAMKLPFSAKWSFQKRKRAKFGQYRGSRTAMLLYRILTMVYDTRTHTLFGHSPSYILKNNAFKGQSWPLIMACFLQNNWHHMIIYTV